jgi:hypothetical protein
MSDSSFAFENAAFMFIVGSLCGPLRISAFSAFLCAKTMT